MSQSFFRWLLANTILPRSRRRSAWFRPALEVLEQRTVPSVYHVTNNLDNLAGFPTIGGSLRYAVEAANAHPGTDVIVFDSALSGNTITLAGGELVIADNLKINGPGANNLTISGNNSSRVFENQAVTAISGLTVTGGNGVANNPADTSGLDGAGGAILNLATLTVIASNLSANSAFVGGGICSFFGANLTVNGCTLSDDSAFVAGGGIVNYGTLNVKGSTFSGNSGFDGGGIFNVFSGTMTIAGCSVNGNAGGDGGGIENDGIATIYGTTLSANSASNLRGGAIVNQSGATLTIFGCTLSGNTCVFGGGAIDNASFGRLLITGCTLSGNSVTGFIDPVEGAIGGIGGGILSEANATLTVRACIFYGNTAGNAVFRGDGGGIECAGGTIMGSTLSGNSATGNGGGINNYNSTVTVNNSILIGKSAGNNGGGIFNDSSGTVIVSNSILFVNSAGNNGGGIFNNSFGTVDLAKSIFCMNSPDNIVGDFDDLGGNIFC